VCVFFWFALCVFEISLGILCILFLAVDVLSGISSVLAKRLAGKDVSEITYFVSIGT